MAALHPQTNATEPDNPRIWSAASVVQIPITRERHGQMLKCVAIHDSYDSSDHTEAVSAKLDVKCTFTSCLLYINIIIACGAVTATHLYREFLYKQAYMFCLSNEYFNCFRYYLNQMHRPLDCWVHHKLT